MSDVSDPKEELEIMKKIIRDTLGEKVLATLETVAKRELDKRRRTEGQK